LVQALLQIEIRSFPFFSGLLVSIDPFKLGISSVVSFQKMMLFEILLLWLFSFLKFYIPDRGMEVGPAITIIEVFFYLLALLPGKA